MKQFLQQVSTKISHSLIYLLEKVILTWQFIALLVIVILAPNVNAFITRLNGVKIGEFQFVFAELAKKEGISDSSINQLNGLSYDELQLFLIKCGDDGDRTNYTLESYSTEKFIKMHKDLDSLGLLKINKIDSNYQGKQGNIFLDASTTEKGRKIHRAILDAIYKNFIEARVSQK